MSKFLGNISESKIKCPIASWSINSIRNGINNEIRNGINKEVSAQFSQYRPIESNSTVYSFNDSIFKYNQSFFKIYQFQSINKIASIRIMNEEVCLIYLSLYRISAILGLYYL